MDHNDFFHVTTKVNEWGTAQEVQTLNRDLLTRLRVGPPAGRHDVEVAVPLAGLVHDQFIAVGTDESQSLSNPDSAAALLALTQVTKRLGVDFDPPFRDFNGFRSYWKRQGASGSGGWQARRELLEQLFNPVHDHLVALEQQSLEVLAVGISPHSELGWPGVDEEIRQLRRRFPAASTTQDYRSIGGHCVGVLEALGQAVYDPATHLRDGETVPKRDETKKRIGRYVEDALRGSEHADLRGLVTKTIEFAQHVKHTPTGTRRDAGIAADAVISLANILRRLDQNL